MTQRGLFILFEGPDRCGKTTQARLLIDALKQRFASNELSSTRFPNYAAVCGDDLAKYLRRQLDIEPRTAHLMFAANRAEMISVLRRTLAAGIHVVCDRYVYSGVAYSVAKGLDIEWCAAIEADLPSPDLVFQLDAEPATIMTRPGFGDERHDQAEFLQRVRAAYNELYNRSVEETCAWYLVDATRSEQELHEFVFDKVDKALKSTEPRGDPKPLFASK